MIVRPPLVGTPIKPQNLFAATTRIEGDLRDARTYGFYGAIIGSLIGLAISGDRISRKTERTVHNILLGASMGALILGYVSS